MCVEYYTPTPPPQCQTFPQDFSRSMPIGNHREWPPNKLRCHSSLAVLAVSSASAEFPSLPAPEGPTLMLQRLGDLFPIALA